MRTSPRVPVADALGSELANRLNAYLELVLTPHRHRTDGMYAAIFAARA